MNNFSIPKLPQNVPAYKADTFRVSNGANLGDSISFAEEMVLDDIYRVAAHPQLHMLRFDQYGLPPFAIASDSALGTPGLRFAYRLLPDLYVGSGQYAGSAGFRGNRSG